MIKIPRYLREYANAKSNELYKQSSDMYGHKVNEDSYNRAMAIRKSVKSCEKGLVTVDEAMKFIANI